VIFIVLRPVEDQDRHRDAPQLGLVEREVDGDVRSVAPADHVHLRDAQVVEQPQGAGGHLLVGDRQVAPGRAAMAATGRGDDPVAGGGENGGQVEEHLGVSQTIVEQQHRLTVGVAVHLVVEGRPIDRRRLTQRPRSQPVERTATSSTASSPGPC
jgi:hypothetical protein